MAPTASRRSSRGERRATRAQPTLNYAESSTDNEFDDDINMNEEELTLRTSPVQRPAKRDPKPRTPSKKRQRPSSSQSHNHSGSSQRSKVQRRKHLDSKDLTSSNAVHPILGSGTIPPWQSLPYHILIQIFQYATYPLYDENTFQPLPSGRWLLSVARLCRSFAEPAFTVLYTTPPLVPMIQAHRLVDLLKADPTQMAFKYRQKVEALHIDVGQVAAYSLPGSGHLDLFGLIKELPRLADLEFYHQKDTSPYRNLDDSIKWTYPEAIFDALEYVSTSPDPAQGDKTGVCRLRSWRWSSRLAGRKWPLEKIVVMHLKPSFAGLQKVAFVNYQVPLLKRDEVDPKHEEVLSTALRTLQNLQHLIFESSTLVNYKLLPMLPKGLRNLELINCWEIIAEDFATFLLTHGSQLRCLTLNHNQSLSLSFLPVLRAACPKLQVLRINLTYFNIHASYRDSEPQYDQLMLPTEIPVWPSTLQTLEITQMRKWETSAAEMFFQSLLDNAGKLPDLRKLSIQAILNIGWRDRATFRDKWVGSLTRTFKRVSRAPRPVYSISKQRHSHELAAVAVGPDEHDSLKDERSSEIPQRKSPRAVPNKNTAPPTALTAIDPSSHQNDKAIAHRTKDPQSAVESAQSARRSARVSVRRAAKGIYAESPENSGTDTEVSAREMARQQAMSKELSILKATAGIHASEMSSPPDSVSNSSGYSSSDELLATTMNDKNRAKGEGKGKERAQVVQGMCEIVEVRIDNLRPTETQVTEADFLDDEIPGDSDWNGDEDGEDDYAW